MSSFGIKCMWLFTFPVLSLGQIYQEYRPPVYICRGEELIIDGGIVSSSDVKSALCPDAVHFRVNASSFYVNMDLNLTGASSLRIYCEKFLVILNDSRIILNGRSGRDEDKSYLASAGESGGEFLLTAESIENGQGLTVYSYGGKGGDGMDGYTAPDIHSQNIKDLYKLHTFYDFNSFKNRAESWYDNSSLICADLNSGGYVIAKNCSYSQGNVCGPSTDGIPGAPGGKGGNITIAVPEAITLLPRAYNENGEDGLNGTSGVECTTWKYEFYLFGTRCNNLELYFHDMKETKDLRVPVSNENIE